MNKQEFELVFLLVGNIQILLISNLKSISLSPIQKKVLLKMCDSFCL